MADDSIPVSPAKTRAQASAMGLNRFFNGRPCTRGHIAERYTGDKSCLACRGVNTIDPNSEVFVVDDNGIKRKVLSRERARASGLRFYFTGEPCVKGHISQRYIRGECCSCSKAFAEANREKLRAYCREYARDPKHRRARAHAKEQRCIALAGRPRPDECEVCGTPGKTRFDHCHLTGHFRGWLCNRCNLSLGRLDDDPELLRKLADYLERHTSRHAQVDWVTKESVRTAIDSRSPRTR